MSADVRIGGQIVSKWRFDLINDEPPSISLTGNPTTTPRGALRLMFRADDDNYYEQPGKLFRLMTADAQQRLFENTARNMGCSEDFIKIRHISNCYKADPDYGRGVADALGISYEKAGIK